MVSPIRKGGGVAPKAPKKKKATAVDVKVVKAAKKVPLNPQGKGTFVQASKSLAKQAAKAASSVKQLATATGVAIKKAALKMQKMGLLSRQIHMAQQRAALKKAAAAEKAKKDRDKEKEREERKKRMKKIFRG